MCLPAGGIWAKLGHTLLASAEFRWGFNFQISAFGCWTYKSSLMSSHFCSALTDLTGLFKLWT